MAFVLRTYENFSPVRVKQYLTKNHLKFCVLAVDAETVKDAYGHLTQRKVEYEELLKTVANAVDEKVVILICDNVSLKSEDDELIVGQTIERTINEKGKGFVAWLKNGKLSVDPDVVVQFFVSPSPAPQPHPQTNLSRDFQQMTTVPVSAAGSIATCSYQRKRNPRYPPEWETGPGWNVPNMQQPAPQTAVTINQWRPPAVTITGEAVLLRSLLRYGKISYHLQDLQLWDPEFFVPDYIAQKLFNKHCNTPVIGVRIVSDHDGQPECSVGQTPKDISKSIKEGVKIAANETLLLKTCIRDGLVSFQENDVDFRYGSFRIPENITDGLRDENQSTPCADLYIILNEKRDLRCIVKLGPIDRIRTFASKRGMKI